MSSESMAASTTYQTDKEILGYSRWVVFIAAFLAMSVISPYEYAWSSMAGPIGSIYSWSQIQIGWMFTLFVVFESIGTLPGGILRDKYGPRLLTIISGVLVALGIFGTSLGPSFGLVLVLWCLGSLFAGFIYNTAVTTANKWFPDKRGLTAGLIAGAFTWGALPFIFPIRAIPKSSPPAVFFHVIYAMAAIIGGVAIICALFMKDPPGAWKPQGWVPKAGGAKRPSEHEYTLGEALRTWQMWVLVVVMFLVTATGLTGVSKAVQYSHSFGFTAAAATAAAGGLALAGGGGRPIMGWLSEYIGRELALILSCILCGLFAFLMLIGGAVHSQGLFLIGVIGIVCFWGATFGLFPTIVGHYYGSVASGSNYGILYAIAKGLAGVFGGVISAVLISTLGLTFTILVSGFMALFAGLICIPLKFHPPVWIEVPGNIPDRNLAR